MPLTPALSQSTSREQLNPRVREREPSGVVDEPVLLRKVGRGWVCPYRFRTLEVSRKMKYYTERSASSIGSLSLWERVRVRGLCLCLLQPLNDKPSDRFRLVDI
ncbi:hypothetical protein DFO62_1112 [Serratia fonticola]|nr:hypothetical protein DFO62_1112 [Serratia fonticola]